MSLHILKTTKNLLFKNIFAYLVIVLVTPALTRMYEPSQFGTLSLMIFFSSFLSVLFTARLELAIPIVKEPLSLNCLIKMLLCSTFVFCFIMSLIVFVFIDDILKLFFSQESYGNWLLITPFYGLVLSISSIFMMVLTKEMNFHEMGLSLLLQNCAFCFLAVSLS